MRLTEIPRAQRQHAIGGRDRVVVPGEESERLHPTEQRLAMIGKALEQAIVEPERDLLILHPLPDVGAQRERRYQPGERLERTGERLVSRHQPAARKFALAGNRVGLEERRMRLAERRHLVERRAQQRQARERERRVVRVTPPPRVAIEAGLHTTWRTLAVLETEDGVRADKRQEQHRVPGVRLGQRLQRTAAVAESRQIG